VTNGGDGSDVTTTALAAEYHAFGFGPVAIYGRLTDTQAPSVLAVGDSILAGYWDTDLKGAFFRAMMAASPAIPFMRCGMPGQTADGFRSPAVYSPVLAAAMDAGITDFVCEYGVNDVQNGYTLAQIQANLQKIWALGTALGARVWQTTITPKTTSTDGYATTANQTRATGFELGGVCDQLNDWIRTTPSPLSGYFDVRLAAESSPGSGLWKAPGHTTDGIHPTPTGAAAHAVAYTTSRFTFP
jgi:lysophospholipase L1-like esterase